MPTVRVSRKAPMGKKRIPGGKIFTRPSHGRTRVIIEHLWPEIDSGRYPIKRIVGEQVVVEVDMFTDGHEAIAGCLQYRPESAATWKEVPLDALTNDRWRASFPVTELGRYRYTVTAWVDQFSSWHRDFGKRLEAGQDVGMDLLLGATLLHKASKRAKGKEAKTLEGWTQALRAPTTPVPEKVRLVQHEAMARFMKQHVDRQWATTYEKELAVVVDPPVARFSAWYEMFPRSSSPTKGVHGTFADCEAWLPYIAGMGFDVLYFPPIHPIGMTSRKGKNNNPLGKPDDIGSPWGIGGPEGGHTAIHSQLGTMEDFQHMVRTAKAHGLAIALDLAFQCSPDHPYVTAHPEWFKTRPDGTVQYAENPPKHYQDIYPLNFDTDDWPQLWEELTQVVLYWIDHGIRLFRVDNPHTKPFRFWDYLITTIKQAHPDVLFLAEAFTRPKVMYHLAKIGFTQSYTYFTWRNTKAEFTHYVTELTQTDVAEYFRPNFWPNTPDILIEHLQTGGRPAFMVRIILAGTLSANYGIYGPAFELQEHTPYAPGSEEYLHSEKFELKHWDIHRPDSLKNLITAVNDIRRKNPALQSNAGLRFHPVDNTALLCYSKQTEDRTNIIVVVANLDRQHVKSGWVDLPVETFGLNPDELFHVHDLLTGSRYAWRGPRQYVELGLSPFPAHIFHIERSLGNQDDSQRPS